jgi:hypothetical protein
MSAAGDDAHAPRTEHVLRRRCVPWRRLGDKVIVARPSDGTPVVLAPTAAVVWRRLAMWATPAEIDARLADVFPDVASAERLSTRAAILARLGDDELLERR